MVFTVLVNIVLCPFSHTSIAIDTSLYVLVQDVSILLPIVSVGYIVADSCNIIAAIAFYLGLLIAISGLDSFILSSFL